MTTNQFTTLILFIAAVAFILWIVSYFQNRNRNVVVVDENDRDDVVERVFEQPVVQPIVTQQPVFTQGFSRGNFAPTNGGAVSGGRVSGGNQVR